MRAADDRPGPRRSPIRGPGSSWWPCPGSSLSEPIDSMTIRVVPVLDLLAGRVVHAIGGDRAHYRPLRTGLHPGSDPIGIARGYRDALHLREVYLADLDAIAGGAPDLALYRSIRSL